MRVYTPPFTITPTIMKLTGDVAFELGKLTGEKLIAPSVYLRKTNTIKTIHSTLGIEGNPLNQEQVTDVIDGKRVLGSAASILEVKNALAIYSTLKTIDPLDIQSLLNAHAVFMGGLIDAPGHFRNSHVRVGHPPSASSACYGVNG